MKDFKLVEGTAEWIEDVATHDDMRQYTLESIRFTTMSYVYKDEGVVDKNKSAFFLAVFRLHRGYNAAGHKV